MEAKMNGKVKWFSDSKGYGFISGEDGTDYFVHYKKILGVGRRTLLEGQSVLFTPAKTFKGPNAEDVEAFA